MKEVLLINISGEDKPGLTASVTDILAGFDVNVLDIGQAVIHDTLSLGVLVEMPESQSHSSVLKDILFRTYELGMQVRFTPITEDSYGQWVSGQGRPRYIVTLLARKITARHISRITSIIAAAELNIDSINRLSGRIPLGSETRLDKACVEFSVRGNVDSPQQFRQDLLELASELDIDIAFQEDNKYRRNRRLVAFDMDSTLIEAEVIDELAKEAGVGEEVAAITEAAMRGELDFTESFRRRVALLKGLDESVLAKVAARLPVTEGASLLIDTLKSLGYRTAILSGGFTYFGERLQQMFGIDYVYANELEIIEGKVTGRVTGQVVDGQRKAELLRDIAKREGIDLQQVISVGDGANDLPMLSIAGLGIAFRAKPLVKQSAGHSISTLGLDGILYLLGISDRHQSDLSDKL
ncbi:phosphoserine phosphatase SerB [Halieaceae bacterium IMCC14734]|uniref:Phosphoserine phosphatase n=1 Tax=Candidatus Litorirhabdus singularis TaxID=2518993 RepID=A0ABT3TC29_9GAMM|nr:phosphoserine phosphatase SerB [Candidatus Litorirhabdus singularis]MCX2979818.1 phosphoserine phosphatase SerB [Candidatus Litorirhabdus singularis]